MFARLVAKYGFSGDASHLAMTSRRSLPFTSEYRSPEELWSHHAIADRMFDIA